MLADNCANSTVEVLKTLRGERIEDSDNKLTCIVCWLFDQMSQQGRSVVSYSRITLRCTMTNCHLKC